MLQLIALVCSSVPCPCAGQNPGLALDSYSGGMVRLGGEVLRGKTWCVGKVPWPLVGL